MGQDVAIKVYFEGDHNAMTWTECKKEVCVFGSLYYVDVLQKKKRKSAPDKTKLNQLGSISSDQHYEETETSECAVVYGSGMFRRKICHSHGVSAKVRDYLIS